MAIYILQIIGFFMGFTFIIALIFNYIKEGNCHNTYLASHHRWQIRTFWFGLLWIVLGIITIPIIVGIVVLAINTIWVIYRIIKGIIQLSENEAVMPYKKQHHV